MRDEIIGDEHHCFPSMLQVLLHLLALQMWLAGWFVLVRQPSSTGFWRERSYLVACFLLSLCIACMSFYYERQTIAW